MGFIKKINKNIVISACALLCIVAGHSLYAHEHGKKKTIEAQKVADSIYFLGGGEGGNLGVSIGEDGTFLIDDKFAPLSDVILDSIKKVGGDVPKFVINTHFHGDHTGGNAKFGEKGSIIVAHENVRKRLKKDTFIAAFNNNLSAQPKEGLPVVTFAESLTLHLNGDTINVMYLPDAHTDGDSVVHFTKANVIHMGDLFFNGFYPFIDTIHGGSLLGLIAGIESLLEIIDDKTVIIPGHGPVANKQDLAAYNAMLTGAHKRLSDLKAEGKSLKDVIKAKPLASLDSIWGDGIFTTDKWIRLIYPSI